MDALIIFLSLGLLVFLGDWRGILGTSIFLGLLAATAMLFR